ncbi:MAG TPA: hypothetical protein VGP18_06920 [Solirubrobacteraceae bacterium]|jgi:hypothetical protein|nr:hypothetical protein [Solirubrobacteraceae bacterium]
MIRAIRTRALSFSAVSLLLTLAVATSLAAPIAVAAGAHTSKQVKKHKKSKKKGTKKVASVKVTAGTATLVFNTQTAQALEKANVTVAVGSPATGALASGFVFPLAGRTLNPATGFGSLTATGGLTFSTSVGVPGFSFGREATVAEPSLSLGSVSTLSFASQQATPPKFSFATVALKGAHPLVDGSTITLTNLQASLDSAGAQFLNEFASGAFKIGETVGSITVQVTTSS